MAGAKIEKAAGNIRVGKLQGIFILELEQATFRTAVAEGFPLLRIHIFKRYRFPKWLFTHTLA